MVYLEPCCEEMLQSALLLQLLQGQDWVVVDCIGYHIHQLILQQILLCLGQSARQEHQ